MQAAGGNDVGQNFQLALQLENMRWLSSFKGFELHQAKDENTHWWVLYPQGHYTTAASPIKKKKSLNKGQHKSSAKEEKGSHLAQWLKNWKHLSLKNGLQFWITGTC